MGCAGRSCCKLTVRQYRNRTWPRECKYLRLGWIGIVESMQASQVYNLHFLRCGEIYPSIDIKYVFSDHQHSIILIHRVVLREVFQEYEEHDDECILDQGKGYRVLTQLTHFNFIMMLIVAQKRNRKKANDARQQETLLNTRQWNELGAQ